MWYLWQVEFQAFLGHVRCGQVGRRWLDQILCKVSQTGEGRKQETQVPLHTPLRWLLSRGFRHYCVFVSSWILSLILVCCYLFLLWPETDWLPSPQASLVTSEEGRR